MSAGQATGKINSVVTLPGVLMQVRLCDRPDKLGIRAKTAYSHIRFLSCSHTVLFKSTDTTSSVFIVFLYNTLY